MTDQEILQELTQAFGAEPRPEHFTKYTHCEECAEHDDTLRARDPATLQLTDVNNAAWDPICFVTDDGFRYYLPALARLALASERGDWYVPQLLFHLEYDGPRNRRFAACTTAQRQAVAKLLWHILETRNPWIVESDLEEDLQRTLEVWSDPAD